MPNWPHLANAPITEALIDIRVQLRDGFGVSELGPFQEDIRDRYPTRRERKHWQGEITLAMNQEPAVVATAPATVGYRFDSADGSDVVQARLDGFTFSRLRPYQTWEHLRDEARSLWDVYRRVAEPLAVTRIAVRFINCLELPVPVKDFKDWILTTPEVAPKLPQALAGFFMRLQLPFTTSKALAIVTQSIKPGDYTDAVPYVFDIDVFDPSRMDADDEQVWTRFEELREVKNEVFFGSLTEKTLELCR